VIIDRVADVAGCCSELPDDQFKRFSWSDEGRDRGLSIGDYVQSVHFTSRLPPFRTGEEREAQAAQLLCHPA